VIFWYGRHKAMTYAGHRFIFAMSWLEAWRNIGLRSFEFESGVPFPSVGAGAIVAASAIVGADGVATSRGERCHHYGVTVVKSLHIFMFTAVSLTHRI
jgi:hypothetical protein